MTTPTTFPSPPLPKWTAADFEMKYDEDHTYPFTEDEDARIIGFGHPDKAAFAAQVNAYYEHVQGGPVGDNACQAADVGYAWAVALTVEGRGEDGVYTDATCRWGGVSATTPGAFPIVTVAL